LPGPTQWQAEEVTDSPADQELADRYRRYNAHNYFTDTGTHAGAPFLGVAAIGRPVQVDEFSVYAWSGGLITEVWVASDRLAALAQLR
jgi:hypothetical protein